MDGRISWAMFFLALFYTVFKLQLTSPVFPTSARPKPGHIFDPLSQAGLTGLGRADVARPIMNRLLEPTSFFLINFF
jgi:hypothetical protein